MKSSSWTTVGTLWRDLFDGLPAGRSGRAPGVSSPPGSGSEDDRDGRAERDRIQAVYGGYTTSGREADRWDDEAPGNRCILAERRVQPQQAGVLVRALRAECGEHAGDQCMA